MQTGKLLLGLVVITLALATAWAWRTAVRADITSAPAAEATEPEAAEVGRVPIVVELFTSEGCSSCPPADEVLQELERKQPIAGAEIIPLSLHVDYWNYIGWADPFSAAAFSERQNSYAEAFAQGRIYTPQMVVDGRAEFVGSQQERAQTAIREALKEPKATVTLQLQDGKPDNPNFTVKVDKLPALSSDDTAEIVLAITETDLHSSVARGENSGRRLTHTAVVRHMNIIGHSDGKDFQANTGVTLKQSWQRANLRAVVFVQERRSRRILGAATIALK